MERTSKILSIDEMKTWDGPNGTVYYYSLTMENGDTGQVGKKSDDAFKVGQELKYTFEENPKGNKIKEVKEPFAGNPGGGQGVRKNPNASFALSYAKDLAVAKITQGILYESKQIIQVADSFLQWLKDNE